MSSDPDAAQSWACEIEVTLTESWMSAWIASVAEGRAAMSQRSVAAIERNGGVIAAIDAAQTRGVHLVRLTDDEGRAIIAASLHPFETLC